MGIFESFSYLTFKLLIGNTQQNQLERSQIDARLQALKIQMATESNALQKAIAPVKADLSRNQLCYLDGGIATQTGVQETKAFAELAREQMN
ncbi:Multidrug efflux pump subunit AcrA [Nostoc flagelliforme CCNUN1]|uniref:Multidrug efflux pump subunit AcrA n=1 Tax=Nostoc flagelliforme CCNUN1 TaxID=2038116 RepID=A0A2K8SRK5_9NOSO|nr:hypothetical protein [Nostoc flagelliforme]AUB38028.1 Multidrug efflux pump subunit AcrA [Nostoc flagelliforme CCNUN1]